MLLQRGQDAWNVFAVPLYQDAVVRRSRISEKAQKQYQKGLQTVSANQGNGVERAMRRPGLSAQALRPSLQQIVGELVRNCTDRGTGQQARNALIALHIPRSVVDAAFDDVAVPLGPCIQPWLGVLHSENTALRIFLARQDASAQDKLIAQMRLYEAEALPIKLPGGAGKNWVKHLAPGKHMADLRRSSMDRECFLRHWSLMRGDRPNTPNTLLRGLWQRCPGNTDQLQGADVDGEDAWRTLVGWRQSLARQEQAEATVVAWVDGGNFAEIMNCLNTQSPDERTRARQTALGRQFAFATRNERNPPRPYTDDDVLSVLHTHLIQTPLTTDTMARFRVVWDRREGRVALLPVVEGLLSRITRPMPHEDRNIFYQALGIPEAEEDGYRRVQQVCTALPHLHQFLLVSEKLQGQTLTKLVASLHDYPTDSNIPALVSRAAALRELRQRLEDSQAPERVVTNALVLARKFAPDGLYRRTLGVGEFGSTLGMRGYALNETGQFIREVVERSLGGTPSASLSLRASTISSTLCMQLAMPPIVVMAPPRMGIVLTRHAPEPMGFGVL